MSNTDKLLRAFIEASGYEVEEVKVPCMPVESDGILFGQDYKIDYKVTKKNKELPLECHEPCVPLPVQSDAWGCIVEFVNDHYGDIEAGINDFDTLRPILNFISRKS